MPYRVQFSPQAKVFIRREGIYLGDRNKRAEARWRNRILLAVKHLESHPDRYPEAHEAVTLGINLREYQIGNRRGSTYRILFTIEDVFVNVLFVRHSAQDWLGKDDL